jgi:TP901 family phage tail tape measure protein
MAESLGEAVLSVRLDSGGLTNSLARLRSDSEGALSGVERKAQATATGMEGAFKRGVENSGRAFDNLAERASTSFASLVGPTGIAAAAIGAVGLAARASINTFADFEQRMKGVQAVLQASGAEMEQLNQVALTTGAETKFSASEAAAAIEELAKQGLSAAEIMGGALAGTTDLAAAAGIGLADAANIASVAMKAFNLQARDLPGIADTIAAAANSSALDVADLGQALQALGPVGRDAGLSFEEVSASLAKLADNGIRGSDAGTSLKTMLQSLTPNTDKAKKAFADLNVSIFDSEGNYRKFNEIVDQMAPALSKLTQQQRAVALETIFGSDATRAASIIFGSSGKSIATYTQEVSRMGEASQNAKTRQDSLKSAQEQLRGSVETLAIRFGQALAPALRTSTNLATSFFNALNDGNPVVVAATGAIAGLVGVITVNGLIAAFRSIIAIAPALGASFTVAFGPLGWVVAGVTALAAGLVALIAQEKEAARVANQQRQAREFGADTTAIEGELNRLLEWRGTLYQRLRHAEAEKNEAGIKYNKQQLEATEKQIEKQRELLQVTKDVPALQQQMTDRYANYNAPAGSGSGPANVGADFSKAVAEAKRLQAAVEAAIKANDPKAWQAASDSLTAFKNASEENAQALSYLTTQTKSGAKATSEYQNALDRIKGVDFRNSLAGMTDAQLKLAAAQAKAKGDADTYATVVGELTSRQQAAQRATESAAQALSGYLDGRKLDKYAQGLENATDKQLELARAVALTSGDLARLQRIDAEIDRRADLRAQKDEQHKAAVASARKEVLEYAQALEKQTRSGELTSESIRDNAEKFTALKARLVEAGVSWNELDGTVRNRVNGALAAQLSLLQRLEGQHTRQIQLTRDLTAAENELAIRLEYQASRLSGLAADTAGAVLQGVYDALNTNDPLNIQGALAKTNAFIETDGFKSLPPSLQEAVRDAIPLMQAVLDDEANLRATVDLDPVFAANTSANTDRLEKWAKSALGGVVDYLETDTTDLERVRKAIEHSLEFDDLDDSQIVRLNAQLTNVKGTLAAIEQARTNYAAAWASDFKEREGGVLTLTQSFEESISVFRAAQAALAGVSTEAGEAGDIFAGLADEVTTELAPIYEALGEGLGGEFVDGIAAGMDSDALAGLLSTVTDDALQNLYQRYANSENPVGELIAGLLDEEAGRRADLNLVGGVTAPKPDETIDYGITGRLNELEGSLNNLDLFALNEALSELNGYLALSELDEGVLDRVEGLKDRTQGLLDLLNGLDFSGAGVGQMMADVAPLFEAVGEVWAQGISDALSNPESFDGTAISNALVTLTDDALQDLYAHFASVDNPMGKLVARLIDDEAAKRAAARLDEPSVVFPQPDATVDYGITPRLEELERGLHTMSVQELSAALEEMNGWLALPDLDATVLARVQALKNGAQGIVDVWTALWDVGSTSDLTNPIQTADVEDATDSIEDFRQAHELGLITQAEYARNLEDEIALLESVSIQTQATKNRIAQLRAELAALTSVTRKVTEGLSAAAGMLQAIDDVSAQGIGRLADTVAGVVAKVASEDYVGAIAQAFTFLVTEVQAAQRETEAFQKSLKDLDKELLFADRSSVSTVSRERGGFLGLGSKEVLKVDEFALEVANTMENAIVNGISNGFMEAIRKGDFSLFSENFRKTIGEAVLQGLIDAFIQGEIVKNILGPAVNKWIEARVKPGVEDDIEASKGLDDAVNRSIAVGEDFYNNYLVPASQRLGLYGIDKDKEPEPTNPFGSVNLPSIGIQSAIATPILESAQSFKLSTDALGVHVGVFGAAASLFNAATARFDATITRLEQAAANGTAGLRYA